MWHCMRVSFWLPSLAWTSTVSSGFKSLLQSWPMAWSKQISWVWATCIGIAGIIHYCNVRQHEHRHAFWMVFYCLALLRANHPFVNTHITTYSLSPVPWTSKALLSSHWNKETIFIARAIIQIRCFCLFLFIIYLYVKNSFKKRQILPKQEKHIRRPAANPTLTPPMLITPPVSSWNSCQPILSKRFRGSVPYMQPLECGCFLQNSCALPGGACLYWLMTCQEFRGPDPCGSIPKTHKWQWQPT